VFDYGQKSAENLVQYVGTNYGKYISKELQNKITAIIVEPVHTYNILMRHGVREAMIQTGQLNIRRARRAQETILLPSVTAVTDL
jgi:hypothetical protein